MARISNLDFYAILGVHPNAEDIVIRAAFKALAQRYHPDRFNGSKDDAHRRMADLTNAYETLADPARRRKYDRRRGLSSRQARFYFKNPERERYPPFTAFALRAAARKAQYYRNAVFVLMVVVVILSAFNVHQHAAQIREAFAWGRSSSGVIVVSAPDAAASVPAQSPANTDASQTTTTNVRVLPIGQGMTRPIVPTIPDGATPASPAPERAVAAPLSVPPVATEPVESPSVATPPASTPPVESPSVATPRVATPPVSAPPVVAPSVPSKPAMAKAREVARPAARPSTAEPDRCAPELLALGLCNRSPTPKGQ